MDRNHLREEYDTPGLEAGDLGDEPLAALVDWLDHAVSAGVPQANAMSLATVDADGRPSVRTVLLKDVDAGGVVFFTNYASRKGRALEANPRAAASLTWVRLHRQIRIEGSVERISAEASDAYFAARPRGAQVAAVASPQSEAIPGRDWLEDRVASTAALHADGAVGRPAGWGGYRIVVDRVEFWQGRRDRLHDRILYQGGPGSWVVQRLAP